MTWCYTNKSDKKEKSGKYLWLMFEIVLMLLYTFVDDYIIILKIEMTSLSLYEVLHIKANCECSVENEFCSTFEEKVLLWKWTDKIVQNCKVKAGWWFHAVRSPLDIFEDLGQSQKQTSAYVLYHGESVNFIADVKCTQGRISKPEMCCLRV